jgi:hypothetical protein
MLNMKYLVNHMNPGSDIRACKTCFLNFTGAARHPVIFR